MARKARKQNPEIVAVGRAKDKEMSVHEFELFLANPDVFTLEYKNGPGKNDLLKTVNLFNPGGLALTTLKTDYAPSGYWSAYRDSQPVALKLSLSFTELRPIYEGDQENNSPVDSVGY